MPNEQPEKPNHKDQLKKFEEQARYGRVAAFALGFMVFGAVFYHYVEKWNWLDSFYFTTITLATVGYGDFAPKTPAGKLFTIFYVLIGITIFITLAKIVLGGLILRHSKRK